MFWKSTRLSFWLEKPMRVVWSLIAKLYICTSFTKLSDLVIVVGVKSILLNTYPSAALRNREIMSNTFKNTKTEIQGLTPQQQSHILAMVRMCPSQHHHDKNKGFLKLLMPKLSPKTQNNHKSIYKVCLSRYAARKPSDTWMLHSTVLDTRANKWNPTTRGASAATGGNCLRMKIQALEICAQMILKFHIPLE